MRQPLNMAITYSHSQTRSLRWIVPAILALGLGFSIVGGILADRYVEEKANDRLNAVADLAAGNIAEHAAHFAGLTRALQVSFLDLPEMAAGNFRDLVGILYLHAGKQPIQSFVFAERTGSGQAEDFLIRYAEPQPGNEKLPGLRLSSNPGAAAAIAQLREGASLATTETFPLQHSAGGAQGMAFLAPIYITATQPPRYALKGRDIAGLVAVTVNLEGLFAQLATQLHEQELHLRVFSRTQDRHEEGFRFVFGDDSKKGHAASRYSAQRDIEVYGTVWRLTFDAQPGLILFPQRHLGLLVPAVGLLLTLMLSALAHTLLRARRVAESYARRATASLTQSEARFRDLTELSSDWYWEQDMHFRFTSMSSGAYSRSGVDISAVIGKARWELPIEGVGEAEWAVHRAQLERHDAFHDFTYMMHTPDKGPRWFAISGRPVFDADGRFTGYRGTGRDITERRQAEDAALRERRLLEAVMEALPVGVWLMDGSGNIVSSNPAGPRIWAGARYVGVDQFGEYKAWRADTGEEILPEEWAAARAFRTGEAILNEKIVIQCFDGSRKTILNSALPLRDAQGRISGAIIVNQDIDALEQAQQEIRQLNEGLEQRVRERTAELEASNRELEAFSYSVSHDLRAPLRGIDGFAYILDEDYGDRLDDTGRSHLQRIRQASQRLSQTIDDIIELARITRAPIHRSEIDLSSMVRDIVQELGHALPNRPDFVVVDAAPAQADPTLLRIALENLLSNALKFSARTEQPRIEFGTTVIAGRPCFFVRDNGAGFDPAFADKLFQPFQRLHNPEEFSGTGIGLATVKRIIDRHGGRIWAESRPGQGATFWFTLP